MAIGYLLEGRLLQWLWDTVCVGRKAETVVRIFVGRKGATVAIGYLLVGRLLQWL